MADDEKKFKTNPQNWNDVLADTLPVLKSTYVPDLGESYQFYNVPGFTGLVVWKHGNVAGDTLADLPVQGLMIDGAQTIPGLKTFGTIPELPASDPTTDNQAARKAYVDATAAAAVSLPAGYIYGLETASAADTDHDVTIAIGKCRDFDDTTVLELTAPMTKRIDATWLAGDTNGGLFSGSVAADTEYFLFLIRKDSDGTIDAGWDTDIDAANIPTGYTAYRRIRWYKTDSGSNFLGTVQYNDKFLYIDVILDNDASISAATPTTYTLTIPGIADEALLSIMGYENAGGSSEVNILITSPLQNSVTPIAPASAGISGSVIGFASTSADSEAGATKIWHPVSNGQIVAEARFALVRVKVMTHGWLDPRGRFGGK